MFCRFPLPINHFLVHRFYSLLYLCSPNFSSNDSIRFSLSFPIFSLNPDPSLDRPCVLRSFRLAFPIRFASTIVAWNLSLGLKETQLLLSTCRLVTFNFYFLKSDLLFNDLRLESKFGYIDWILVN